MNPKPFCLKTRFRLRHLGMSLASNMRGLTKVMSGLQEIARSEDGGKVAQAGERKSRGPGKAKGPVADLDEGSDLATTGSDGRPDGFDYRFVFSSEAKLPRLFKTFADMPPEVAADALKAVQPEKYRKGVGSTMFMTRPQETITKCLGACGLMRSNLVPLCLKKSVPKLFRFLIDAASEVMRLGPIAQSKSKLNQD